MLKLPFPCANLNFLMPEQAGNLFREIPSVDRLLKHARCEALLARYNREYITSRCRELIDELRLDLRQGKVDTSDLKEEAILRRLENQILSEGQPGHIRVINATGTILHTNLGRAALPQAAIEAMTAVAGYPVNLEFDLAAGKRGRREETLEKLLVELTGAEAATVVNNNAAAVLLGLNTLADGKEVIVSRGELIEIGGSFRIPEIMAKSGAILREVGTTNRTHAYDYQRAIGENTALLLKVHTSNFRIVGFSSGVGLSELVAIGREYKIPVMEDLGSGALLDLSQYGLPKEPVVAERISLGADIVTFSGDKVLGGPQAGLIVGAAAAVSQLGRNPLHRALRCGKLTIAALEATLRLYRESSTLAEDLPTLRAFTRPLAEMEKMGKQLMPALGEALGPAFRLSLLDSTSQVGSGALPTEEIPTKVIAVEHETMGANQVAEKFRRARPPIIGRVKDDRFLLDLRTIFDPADLIPT